MNLLLYLIFLYCLNRRGLRILQVIPELLLYTAPLSQLCPGELCFYSRTVQILYLGVPLRFHEGNPLCYIQVSIIVRIQELSKTVVPETAS